jgi:hypothetical protein
MKRAPAYEPLPAFLGSIQTAAGHAAAIEIALEFGGACLFLPKNPRPESRLVRAVGMEAAKKICAIQPGSDVYIPLAKPPCARFLAAQGVTLAEIQRLLKAGASSVDSWVNGRAHPMQLGLPL